MKQRGRWRGAGLVACAMMIAVLVLNITGMAIAGQTAADSTPAPGGQDGPDATLTPVVGSASGQDQPAQATEPATQPASSGPVASGSAGDSAAPVLAQGLIYLTGDDVILQVREVELSGSETVTGNARVIVQRSGATVVRNDVTGKRARLEPGEAYFASAGDPYTTYAEGSDPSVMWIFEVSNSNEVGPGAFYLSPDVPGYAEAVYDFELTRHVVPEGGSADFAGGVGPSLLMVLSGTVDVTLQNDVASLEARDGLIVDGAADIRATGGEAVVVTATIGPQVSDASAGAPEPPPATEETTETADTSTPEETQEAAPAEPAEPSDDGAYVTSIKVGAVESVGITMYADGELVFDGWLEAGEWSEFFTGTVFEVYTTSGANTMFQNTCSTEPFWMDYEPGETYYVLEAGPSSCAPAG